MKAAFYRCPGTELLQNNGTSIGLFHSNVVAIGESNFRAVSVYEWEK